MPEKQPDAWQGLMYRHKLCTWEREAICLRARLVQVVTPCCRARALMAARRVGCRRTRSAIGSTSWPKKLGTASASARAPPLARPRSSLAARCAGWRRAVHTCCTPGWQRVLPLCSGRAAVLEVCFVLRPSPGSGTLSLRTPSWAVFRHADTWADGAAARAQEQAADQRVQGGPARPGRGAGRGRAARHAGQVCWRAQCAPCTPRPSPGQTVGCLMITAVALARAATG